MTTLLGRLIREEEAQDLIEYALLAAFIALACVAAMGFVGGGVNTLFQSIKTKLEAAASSTPSS